MSNCMEPQAHPDRCGCGFDVARHSRRLVEQQREQIDALRAENERLERERAEQWSLRRDREAERDTNAAVITQLRAELAARPTQEAYDLSCAALWKHRDELAALNERGEQQPVGYRARFLKEPGIWMTEWDRPIPEDRNPAAEYQLLYAAPAALRQPVAGEPAHGCEYAGCCARAFADTSLCLDHHTPKARAALSAPAPAAGPDVGALVEALDTLCKLDENKVDVDQAWQRALSAARAALAAHKAGEVKP